MRKFEAVSRRPSTITDAAAEFEASIREEEREACGAALAMGAKSNLNRIAEIIESVEHRAQFGAVVTPTLQAMTKDEMSAIYALAMGHDETWRP